MIKKILKLVVVFILVLLVYPNVVSANFGDLNYRITDVNISQNKITFKGWAFIHRTNNYVVHGPDNNGKAYGLGSDGGQKILMQLYTKDSSNKEKLLKSIVVDGSNDVDYNFYADLFNQGGIKADSEEKGVRPADIKDYKDHGNNGDGANYCSSDDITGLGYYYQCLYEDISFSITFDISEFSSYDNFYFKIGASNNHFKTVLNSKSGGVYDEKNYYKFSQDNSYYTALDDVYITEDVVNCKLINYDDNSKRCSNNDYFIFASDSFSNKVEFIAADGLLYTCNKKVCTSILDYKTGGLVGTYKIEDNKFKGGCINNYYLLKENDYEIEGSYSTIPGIRAKKYYIYINSESNGMIRCPHTDEKKELAIAIASHVRVSGINNFKLITDNPPSKCELSDPGDKNLNCNNSKELISTCDKLTVNTDEGNVNVKIEQKGTISAVLSPNRIYAGGGVNLGLLYTNTIKWNYFDDSKPNYHNAINSVMNDKIKDINDYIAGIDISNLKIANKTFNLIKQCKYNRENDYYNDELTVTCLFTVPESKIGLDGNVVYSPNNINININNKYYTDLDYNGEYSISATIIGLDRFKEKTAINDSEDNTVAWTGNWDVNLECYLNVYSLLEKYIYRPVDLAEGKMFPNRNPGINWFEWYKDSNNKQRLANTYKNKYQYSTMLNNAKIAEIKEYNSNNNYLMWDSINPETFESSFVDKYVERGAGDY